MLGAALVRRREEYIHSGLHAGPGVWLPTLLVNACTPATALSPGCHRKEGTPFLLGIKGDPPITGLQQPGRLMQGFFLGSAVCERGHRQKRELKEGPCKCNEPAVGFLIEGLFDAIYEYLYMHVQ